MPVADTVTPKPFAVRVPAVIVRGPFSVDFREAVLAIVSDPPVNDSVSLLPVVTPCTVMLSPFWMVMVWGPLVLMTAMSAVPGTLPVLQLAPTSQLPLPLAIQFTWVGR